jgi:hypothetical protein
MHTEPFACPRCEYEIHGDPGAWFATCPKCDARLLRRPALGWQLLTQAELDRLEVIDLRWHKEKDSYRVWDRMGSRLPSIIGSILGLLAFMGGGAFLIWWGRTQQAPAQCEQTSLIGLFIMLLGGGYAVSSVIKASQYGDAYKDYQRRRLEAVLQSPPVASDAIQRRP